MESTTVIVRKVADTLKASGPDRKGWYTALCPFHNDRNTPNLRFTENGYKCMACGAKGPLRELADKIGIDVPPIGVKRGQGDVEGVTLAQLAQAKGLPLEHLHSLGWRDVEYRGRPAVEMPCRDPAGAVLRNQIRVRLEKGRKRDGRFVWGSGQGLWLMGLDRMETAREASSLLIVEGATDYAACSLADIPILGVPGANTWRKDWAAYVKDISRLVVWQEPGASGLALVRSIAKVRSDVLVIEAPSEAKDPCELRQLDPEGFPQRMAELIAGASSPDLGESDLHDEELRSGTGDPVSGGRGSAADRAIAYVLEAGAELFHDQHGDAFIAYMNEGGLREIWPLKGKAATDLMSFLFYELEGKGLAGEALATARGTLAAHARFRGSRHELSLRVAEHDEAFWYDLGDWRAVKISSASYEVVKHPPVMFRHYAHQTVQVEPQSGGNVDEFLCLLNVRDTATRLLLKVYLVASLLAGIPLPLLIIYGEQGSAKTILFKLLRALIDPSSLATLAPPANIREFIQVGAHHRTVYLDNLSSVPEWLSDALCRLCTGEGFTKRELYTDDNDVVYAFRGLGGVSGINLVATRPDVLDRGVVVKLEPISDGQRVPEEVLWARFDAMRPRVLGAMFDALVAAMRLRSEIDIEQLPRLADFAKWGVAIAQVLGHGADEFLQAYGVNVASQNQAALEDSLVAQALLRFTEIAPEWTGTSTELLAELVAKAEQLQVNVKAKQWPKGANVLSKRLHEVAPNLRRVGVDLGERSVHGVTRWSLSRRDVSEKIAPTAVIATNAGTTAAGSSQEPHLGRDRPPPEGVVTPPQTSQLSFESGDGDDRRRTSPASTGDHEQGVGAPARKRLTL